MIYLYILVIKTSSEFQNVNQNAAVDNHFPKTQYLTHFPLDKMAVISQTMLSDAISSEKFCILIKISPKFVPKGLIDNNPALVQIMAWHRTGDKPLSEPMLTQFTDANMRH